MEHMRARVRCLACEQMEKAVRWAIASAEQAELPEHARPTCTIFTLPERKANAYTKLMMGHPTVTIIDTIPASYHKYAEPDTWTGGKHQAHKHKPAALTIFAVTNTAGQQHLWYQTQPFMAAWNTAKHALKGNMGTPTTLKQIQLPRNNTTSQRN